MAKTHGLAATYRHGCRCDECRAAHTKRNKEERAARAERPAEQIPHGPSGYSNWRCRCDICKAAGSVKNAKNRQDRRARQAGGKP